MLQTNLALDPKAKFKGSLAEACLARNSRYPGIDRALTLHMEVPGLISFIDTLPMPVLHEFNTSDILASMWVDAYLANQYAGIHPLEYFDGYFTDDENGDDIEGYEDFCYGEVCYNCDLVFQYLNQWAPGLSGINELSGVCYSDVNASPPTPMPKYVAMDSQLRAEWMSRPRAGIVSVYMEPYE